MAVLLALASALLYGSSDFINGHAGRRHDVTTIAVMSQIVSLAVTLLALPIVGAHGPTAAALGWGALSGVGGAIGVLALYRGLANGKMSVIAPLSAVLTAGLPAIVGLATGDHLSPLTAGGLVLALPAVLLIAREPGSDRGSTRSAVIAGLVAGAGFAFLFITLDRAGTASGPWPLVPGQAVASALLVIALVAQRGPQSTWRPAIWAAVAGGVLGGVSNMLYLSATGHGELSVVAVISALYPASTVLLARIILTERWSRVQVTGLLLAAGAVAAISVG